MKKQTFKKILSAMLFASTSFVATAHESGYVTDAENLRVASHFNYSAKAVATAFEDELRELGMQPSTQGEHPIHVVVRNTIAGPAVKPKYPNLTNETTMLRYAVYVDPSSSGSSAQVLILMQSPSAQGDGRVYDVSLDHADTVIEMEKSLLDRVAARLNLAPATQPK